MNKRRHPIHNLTMQLRKHGAFSRQNLPKIALFYLKLVLQEPLRILEEVNYSKAIREHSLGKDPIFIIGHWRSGTSFLQYLLGQDSQFGYMNKFQVVFPDIFLYSESFLKPFVSKIPKTFNLTRDAQNMSINLDLDSPSEIEIALSTMISPASLHWGHIFPKSARQYFDKYLYLERIKEEELNRLRQDYRYLIKKVSLQSDGE
ncbi:MAG: sulfotransferase, partial [Balneolaceae bacterium]|nr:sulfotransferase [Balneolaceae bacterium]